MSMSTEGGGNQLMVDVITPQTWIRQYRPKSRRVALSHRRRITIIKAKRHKAINSQELIFQKLLESQFLTRRSSSIGSQFDPFQSFPVSAPAVSHMAQYCMFASSHLPQRLLHVSLQLRFPLASSSGMGPSTWSGLCL